MKEVRPVFQRRYRQSFADWLELHGGMILEKTNEWEVLRYKLPKVGTFVIYENKTGKISISPDSAWHYELYATGKPLSIVTRAEGKTKALLRRQLRLRDGDVCCLCGCFLKDDETIEHWHPIDGGGNNEPRNCALAHKACNHMAGNMSVMEKIRLRDRIREIVDTLPPWVAFEPSMLEAPTPSQTP